MRKMFVIVLMLLTVAAFGLNPVVVDDLGGGDFTTIQAAINSWCTGGTNAGETAPFIINVTNGPYDEGITLDDAQTGLGDIVGDIIIQSATPGTKVVVKLQVPPGGVDDGLYVYQSNADVTFIDLVFCPSMTGTIVTDDLVKVDENAASQPSAMNVISFLDCTFSDIDTGGNPVVQTKADWIAAPKPPTYTPGSSLASGDVILKCWGDTGESNQYVLEDCVFYYHYHNARIHNDGSDGESKSITDCLFSASADWNLSGVQVGGTKVCTSLITGTQAPRLGDLTQCTAMIGSGWHAIWVTGATNTVTINNTLIHLTNDANARGISSADGSPLDIDDCIIRTSFIGILSTNNNADTIDNTTIATVDDVGGAVDCIDFFGAGTGSLTVRDCIFSDAPVAFSGTAPALGADVDYSAYVESGPNAIGGRGGVAVDGPNVINADPLFLGSDPLNANYYDVDNGSAAPNGYQGAGTGASNLGGGGTYQGGSPVADWSVY
jgi:hypothetical protein